MSPCSNHLGKEVWHSTSRQGIKEIRTVRHLRIVCFASLVVLVIAALPQAGSAQNLVSDARRIGLGGAGGTDNIASQLMEGQQSYRAIPIPFGIFQLINNRKFFDPNDPEF